MLTSHIVFVIIINGCRHRLWSGSLALGHQLGFQGHGAEPNRHAGSLLKSIANRRAIFAKRLDVKVTVFFSGASLSAKSRGKVSHQRWGLIFKVIRMRRWPVPSEPPSLAGKKHKKRMSDSYCQTFFISQMKKTARAVFTIKYWSASHQS